MTRTPRRRTPGRPRRHVIAAATLAIGLGIVLTGCSEDVAPAEPSAPQASETSPTEPADEGESTASDPTETPEREAQTIDITVSGDSVDPSGERVEASVGEEIILNVTADAPGEIHVHSTPEQELTYDAGTTELPLTIDQPGVVEVESHDLDLVIVQLEIR